MDKLELKNELLYKMQTSFPLTKHPFKDLANQFNVSEDEVINLIKEAKKEGILRQTSAIFDTKRVGYKSSLVAFKVDKDNIDFAKDIINSHPGVSHNYLRDNEFNIWFTIAIAPNSKLGLEKTVEILKQKTNAKDAIILPTIKMFKIAVKMDTTGKAAKKEKVGKKSYKDINLTPLHIKAIKELQKDIDIVSEPFKSAIDKLNLTYEEFFNIANELKEAGVMRRFATILNHRKAGFSANAMSVWDVDEDSAKTIGEKLASFSAVSHCYLRPKFKNWPYNLFAMVHAKTKKECDSLIEEMAKEVGVKNYSKLYSTKEFKKQRIVYFSDEFEKWEEKALF
jgi:DNA-binding Lrp family transcriptional regulator